MLSRDIKIEFLNQEWKQLLREEWTILNSMYPYVEDVKCHRTIKKEINFIEDIKYEIINKLGTIPTFTFLVDFFSKYQFPGPYNNIEKGLLIIYQLLSGKTIREMEIYLPSSSFYDIYRTLYIKCYTELNSWIDSMLEKKFSTSTIRMLSASLNNPSKLKHVTMLLDGHDTRIIYENINFNKAHLYSYKLKKSGLRTQVCIDINGMVLFISQSVPCKINTDGKMLEDLKIYKKMSISDCLLLDGGYTNHIENIIEVSDIKGGDITLDNFCFPIRKKPNIDLTNEEINFNDQLAGQRSQIESFFADISNTFQRFKPKTPKRITDPDTYNVQYKLACLLFNINNLCKKCNIESEYIHTKWAEKGFDFPKQDDNNKIIMSPRVNYKLKNMEGMKSYQEELLHKNYYKYIKDKEVEVVVENTCDVVDKEMDDF